MFSNNSRNDSAFSPFVIFMVAASLLQDVDDGINGCLLLIQENDV